MSGYAGSTDENGTCMEAPDYYVGSEHGAGGLFSVVVKRSGAAGRAGRKTLREVGCYVACGQEEKRMQGRAMGNGRGM